MLTIDSLFFSVKFVANKNNILLLFDNYVDQFKVNFGTYI